MKEFKIGKRKIGPGNPSFIIAELSGNHHQKFEEAAELVRKAARAGADAVKLQTYTPDTITLKSDKKWFVVSGKDQPKDWKKRVLWDLYNEAYTPWDWQPKLKKLADNLGIILFSSPFDETAVDFLEEMEVPCYKIASYEVVHIPLLKKIAKTGKPVIMSVGFASIEEIELALQTLRQNGAKDIALLHCVTAYSDKPDPARSNLKTISDLRERFKVEAGFSDNNSGIEIPLIAATVGKASLVEKHLTLDRTLGGPDARFSLEPEELNEMISLIRQFEKEGAKALQRIASDEYIKKALGNIHYGPASREEKENIVFRPALWVHKEVKKGEKFSRENTRVARPGGGLLSKEWEGILGKTAARNIPTATPLTLDLVK